MIYREQKCLRCSQIYRILPEHEDQCDGICPTCKIEQMRKRKMKKKISEFWYGIKKDTQTEKSTSE